MAPEWRRGLFVFLVMAGDSVQFTIQLIDKLSRPAKRMAEALAALKPMLEGLGGSPVTLKLPAPPPAPRVPKDPMGPMYGPGRKEQLASLRFQERETARLAKLKERTELKLARDTERQVALVARAKERADIKAARAADQLVKAQARSELREQRRVAKASESLDKQRASSLFRQFQANQRAQAQAARQVARAQFNPQALGALKDTGMSFQSLTGITPRLAAGIAAVGAAAVGATIAIVGLGAGIIALAIGGASLAIKAAEAKQDTLDMLEAMLGGETAAKNTYAQLLGITRISAASKEQVTTAAQELAAAGIDNQQALVGAVRSIAQVESVLKGSGSKIQSVFEKAAQTGKFEINAKKLTGTGVQTSVLFEELSRRTGVGVKQVEAQLKAGKISAETGIAALSAVIDKKFGGVAAKQALDLPVQIQRLKDNFSRLFDGVKVEVFLTKFAEIVDLFDESTMAGTAMKGVITTIFDSVFRLAEEALPYLKVGLKGLVIIALQIAIAFKPLIARLRDAFGGDARNGPLTFARILSAVGRGIRFVLDIAVGLATWTPMWKTLGFFIGMAARFVDMMVGSVVSLTIGLTQLAVAGFAIIDWLTQLVPRAIEAGASLVSGLATGIANAASTLYDSVTGIAGKALALFKQKFGIASPSKVMMGMGVNLSLGLAQGIKAGAPAANDNMMRAVSPPRAMAQQTATARGFVVQIEKVEINGVAGVAELGDKVSEVLSDIFERVALTQGRGAAA